MHQFSKAFQLVAAVTILSTAGCSTLNNIGTNNHNKPLAPRSTSIYDTSGFAFTADGATEVAVRNAKAVCGSLPIQVVSDNPKSLPYEENGQSKPVYILDMSYRCGEK